MSDENDEPTQQTMHGETIPMPTREAVFRDLEKVAKPKPAPRPSQRESGSEE